MKHFNFALRKPFNLQLFADEQTTETNETVTAATTDPENTDKKTEDLQNEKPNRDDKQFSQNDVDRIIKNRLKQAQKENQKLIEEARSEAEKLAKMNEEQKKQYEQEKMEQENQKLKEENGRLKKEAERSELSKSAAQILQEQHKILATQDILDFVVGDNAEDTNERIEKLVSIIAQDRKNIEAERAIGRTPKAYHSNHTELSAFDKKLQKYSK